jgi:chitinase
VTVRYAAADGTAVAGTDYQATFGTLSFAPGETTKTISVPVYGDRAGEPDETFVVNLSDATNATISDPRSVGTIVDDEPRVSIGDVSRGEGNTGEMPFVFTVGLSAAYDAPVTVDWTTANGSAAAGSDYLAAGGTLTFAPGETTRTIGVAVLGDGVYEGDEAFTVNLGNAGGALITRGAGGGTILNDDSSRPRISIGDASRTEGRSGNTLLTFIVTLSAPSAVAVKVGYATADGTAKAGEDYEAAAGTLTFAPGETSKVVTIKVKGDQKREADETFVVNLAAAAGASVLDGQGVGTIRNDDWRD